MQNIPAAPNQPPIPALVNLLRSGQIAQLAREAKNCSTRWPKSGPVWHLLGLAHLNLGQPGEAVSPLTRASKLLPREGEIAEHLAIALMQSGRSKEAYRAFETCLTLAPGQLGLLINLAHLANELGNPAAAERHCRQILHQAPEQPEALFNLGRALRATGKLPEAITAFRDASRLTANSTVAQNDIGLQLFELGATTVAEACFARAIALAPGNALAHSNLGKLRQTQGRTADALAAFQRALELEPGHPALHANLAGYYTSERQFEAAEAACRRALALDPAQVGALTNLGNALAGQRRNGEAQTCFEAALKLAPDHADARNNLANLFQQDKRFAEAEACFRAITDDRGYALGQAYHCAAHLCDWRHRTRDEAAIRARLCRDDTYIDPFGLLILQGEEAPALQRRAGWLSAVNQMRAALEQPPLVAADTHPARDRLRIGYLSADFHDHATMHLLRGVLADHNRERFSIHLYSSGPDADDDYRRFAKEAADGFREIQALTDREAAELIAADGIDILVDLKGYTQDSRLGITALRPAPVIVSWLGYPGTLGHPRLADYIIGDPIVTPPEHAQHYSETLALMPHCYQPNDRQRQVGPRPSRQEAGLPNEGFVFCSFNQGYKIGPETFEVWCQLLREVPGSVLWLLESTGQTAANLRREAAGRGISPERLIFAPRIPLANHLGRLQLADLALDTFPYGSHTTGSDALWVGVPLIARTGETFASRVAASLLNAVGLPELVAESWEQYRQLALALAREPEQLAEVKGKLAARRLNAPLFDTRRFTHNLERLLGAIWEQHAVHERAPVRILDV